MLETYYGSCHCGTVKFEAAIDLTQNTYRCNCSICRRTRFWAVIAKPESFHILQGESDLIQYLFNTKKNHHYFCKHCGVRAFGIGNDTPIGKMIGVNVMCIDDVSEEELAQVPIKYVDGRNNNWHEAPLHFSHL